MQKKILVPNLGKESRLKGIPKRTYLTKYVGLSSKNQTSTKLHVDLLKLSHMKEVDWRNCQELRAGNRRGRVS